MVDKVPIELPVDNKGTKKWMKQQLFYYSSNIIVDCQWKYLLYAGKIGKRSFIFLRFGLPSTLVRQKKNGAFRKRFLNQRYLRTLLLFVLVWTRNILKTVLFEPDDVGYVFEFFSNTNQK